MSGQIWATNWTDTPLGDLARWPQSLKTTVNILLNAKQPMFAAWGPELVFLYNDAYAPILGQKHPSALGRRFEDVWSDIWNDISPLVTRALAGEATWADDLHLVMERNGYQEDTWYSFSYSPVRDDADAIAGMFCACIETTAQVLAQRKSTAERERLFEMTRDLFGVATFSGFLTTLNPAWSRVLGRSDESLLARPFADIIHPDDLAVTGEVVARLERGEPVHQFHVRLLKADGEAVSFAWSAFPDTNPGSGLFYTVGRDISEDLRRDEALRQSQKMEAVGQLTGGIAHDFNNLLQVVHGNLDLIRRKPDDPDRVVRLASNGLIASERGAKLTAQLLAFSRSQRLELRSTAIAPLLVGTEQLLQRTIGPLVRVTIDPGDRPPAAWIDATQLEMALLNLAINARDAMPDGGELRISASERHIETHPALAPGRYVEIRVADTGTGMSPDVEARAFEPFFTTKRVGEGSGLGLSQVYAMVAQAGGSVRIEQVHPTGTCVVLLLKVADEAAADIDPPPTEAKSRPLGRRTILVIDDDPEVRAFLLDSLETLGSTVISAEDGPSGLAALESVTPDLIVLDFAMPGMTGAEVADRVRSRQPNVPIVFATGYSDSEAIAAAVGPTALLLKKPFRIAELEAVMARALAD